MSLLPDESLVRDREASLSAKESRSADERIRDLLSRMTLEEKVAQLHQGSVGDTNPNNLVERTQNFLPTYGSFIVGGPNTLAIRNAIQRRAIEESRLGIPAIFAADVIHGWRAITPIPLAQACSWNPTLVRQAAAMAAEEARAQGVDWTFAPMIDHCVDARWGRIAETFGESPYASGVFAVAAVQGFQGERLDSPTSVAACLKHFVGYGASEGGRDYSSTEISEQNLWERHLPPFAAGVQAGARTVMSAFNDLNGVPASANRFMLKTVLRERWQFQGVVVSDWNAVLQLIQQGYVATEAEAARTAFDAGVDVDMADALFVRHLEVKEVRDRSAERAIDEAVGRVLRLKFELGLFERPFTEPSRLTDAPPNVEQLALAERIAVESIVLLKNDGVLPLYDGGRDDRARQVAQSQGEVTPPTFRTDQRRIALIGPLAENRTALLGSWAQQGRADETPTIAEVFAQRLPEKFRLYVERGCSVDGAEPADFSAACSLARSSDIVVLCLGEEARMSGENASRSTLRFAGKQEELALAILGTGQPVVVVVVSGRPLDLHAIEPKAAAIVAAWQGGTRAAAALFEVLFGKYCPSGRLAVTWPRTTGQIPISHLSRPRARRGDEGAYQDISTTPLYEFGYGLSYTTFEYSTIRLSQARIGYDETLVAEVTVSNVGSCDGAETVFWFIRDPAASITRPLRELKYFEKIQIPFNAERVVRFEINPRRDLSFPNGQGEQVLEPGTILLFAGSRSVQFEVIAST